MALSSKILLQTLRELSDEYQIVNPEINKPSLSNLQWDNQEKIVREGTNTKNEAGQKKWYPNGLQARQRDPSLKPVCLLMASQRPQKINKISRAQKEPE